MKNILTFLAIALLFTACYEDHSEVIPGQDFIPEEILVKIRENGQPIFEGLNPPDVTGRYFTDPVTLVASNFDDPDNPGNTYSPLTSNFTDFNDEALTLKVDVEQGSAGGSGYGSFISGSGNDFTIYVRIERERDGVMTLQTWVYSGSLQENGIANLYLSIFMIDDGGDPNGNLLDIGHGRLFEDADGFSPRVD